VTAKVKRSDFPDIARLRAEGLTLSAIGERYGCTGQRIHQILGRIARLDAKMKKKR
jgi:DNA-binding CsgD family transcriptional regulator